MNKFLAPALLAIALALPCRAAAPSPESIDRLLEASKVADSLKVISANLDSMIQKTVARVTNGQKLTDADRKVLDTMRAEVMKDVAAELNWTEIRKMLVEVYSATFDQQEIDGLVAFYESPVGKAYAAKQPELAQRQNELVQQRMIPIMAKVRAEVTGALEQIQAAHDASAPAAPSAGPIKINP
jgi:uncharacterized protein